MAKSVTIGTAASAKVTAGAAHDLRNLLFVVSAHAHRLLATAEKGHPWLEDIRSIQEAADRSTELASQILTEARMLDQPVRPIDVNAVIEGVEPLLAQMVGDRVRLTTALSAQVWPITANSVQIEQIVMNLAVNARDAMPSGGDLHITTENRSITGTALGQPAHFVVISVSDTGTGIEPAVQERMFEPYFTTKAASGGTGVGLATVRNIALLHGGHVEVSTIPGEGTTFRVALPRAPLENGPSATRPSDPAAQERALSAVDAPARVLIVEHEPAQREFLSACLRDQGHQVAAVENGAEALGWSQTTAAPADVLITDLFLPDLNGLDVATRMREQWPGLRVVFLSDGHGPVDTYSADVPLVTKPFTATDLRAAMSQVMPPHRAA
jgi:CheY-like chemotaxis protein